MPRANVASFCSSECLCVSHQCACCKICIIRNSGQESLVRALGMPELVMKNTNEYEDFAVRCAVDKPFYAQLRKKVFLQRYASTVFDLPAYTRAFEKNLSNVWHRYVTTGEHAHTDSEHYPNELPSDEAVGVGVVKPDWDPADIRGPEEFKFVSTDDDDETYAVDVYPDDIKKELDFGGDVGDSGGDGKITTDDASVDVDDTMQRQDENGELYGRPVVRRRRRKSGASRDTKRSKMLNKRKKTKGKKKKNQPKKTKRKVHQQKKNKKRAVAKSERKARHRRKKSSKSKRTAKTKRRTMRKRGKKVKKNLRKRGKKVKKNLRKRKQSKRSKK